MIEPLSPDLVRVLKRIPEWAGRDDLVLERVGGLTNVNYRVRAKGDEAFLRVSGRNTAWLGIDRALEYQVLKLASAAGIGPQVRHFLLPEGHMVTLPIRGREWSFEDYATPETLGRVVATVKRIHALPTVRASFSPFRCIQSYGAYAETLGVKLPADFARFRERLAEIQAEQRRDPDRRVCCCHNDLYAWNLLDDGSVRVLDWEFAGMGDPYYDLATLVCCHDSEGPLPPELQDELLRAYFGKVTPSRRSRLQGMLFVLNLFTAMWGFLHGGLVRVGLVQAVEDFDYLEYGQNTLEAVRACL